MSLYKLNSSTNLLVYIGLLDILIKIPIPKMGNCSFKAL